MKFFLKLNSSFKIAILTYLVSLVGFLALLFLFFIGHMDIPLGAILAGAIIGSTNLIVGFIEKSNANKDTGVLAVIFVGVRTFIILGIMVVLALMYYRWGMPYFNIISFVAVYTVNIIITVIVHIKERR